MVRALKDKPAVEETGLLFPRGDLEDGDPARGEPPARGRP